MIPRPETNGLKDGSDFENHLWQCWGREGGVSWLVMKEFVRLSKLYSWQKVYDIVEYSGKMNKKNFRYCEVALQKEAEREQQMLNKQKAIERTVKDDWDFPEEPKPVAGVSRSAKWEEETREVLRKLKAGEPID